jgi:hypothetical protein
VGRYQRNGDDDLNVGARGWRVDRPGPPAAATPPPAASGSREAPPPVTRAPQSVRIGLWGPTGGGKSTFLGSLSVACGHLDESRGSWTVWGQEDADTKFQVRWFDRLVHERRFPPATVVSEQWNLRVHGDLRARQAPGLLAWLRSEADHLRHRDTVDIVLDVLDVPGAAFVEGTAPAEAALTHLAGAQGVLLLFDPTLDLDGHQTGTVAYIDAPLLHLATRLDQEGKLIDGRLPHHVAVCLTKFDEEAVFRQALDEKWVDVGPAGPFVPDNRAEAFFDWLCRRMPSSGASLGLNLVRRYLMPERTRFFVTSSIGFYRANGRFDVDDHANIIRVDGETRIRGDLRPINVIEPLIQLERKIRTGQW